MRRWQHTLPLGAAKTGLAVMRLTEHFTTFLELFTNVFGPLVGVALADYFLVRRTRLDLDSGTSAVPIAGRQWCGMNLAAWAATAAGVIAAVATPVYMLGSLVAIGVAGSMYYLLVTRGRRAKGP